jgi:hypothetical protein
MVDEAIRKFFRPGPAPTPEQAEMLAEDVRRLRKAVEQLREQLRSAEESAREDFMAASAYRALQAQVKEGSVVVIHLRRTEPLIA